MRVALTPRNRLLKAKLSNGAVVYGANRPGFGGRAVYLYRDAVEPEFEHLEGCLDVTGVFFDIGANTGKYAIKAATHYRTRASLSRSSRSSTCCRRSSQR